MFLLRPKVIETAKNDRFYDDRKTDKKKRQTLGQVRQKRNDYKWDEFFGAFSWNEEKGVYHRD